MFLPHLWPLPVPLSSSQNTDTLPQTCPQKTQRDKVGSNTKPSPHNLATIPRAAYGASCQGHLNAKTTDEGRGVCCVYQEN